MDRHLYPTMCKHTALERLCTYIWPCLKIPHWKGSRLIVNHAWKHHIEKDQHLQLTMLKSTASKGLYTYIWPCSKAPHWKGMHSHLIMEELILPSHQNGPQTQTKLPGNWLGASIPRMIVSLTSILLDRMASTHIPDIVILDLDMLQLVRDHWIL